uniref:DNA mismatch repair protein MutS n=2 Tax=Candidatus Bipolaricaulota TaxID=67810 RepID=H5SI58_9BACT|nr:DNA mismatch repair protein MutS [uncultured Acetothermia bacterium]BAL58844.1 DNA mismatch repair protein MutS [Candidatus Acetothermum autotrophicum]
MAKSKLTPMMQQYLRIKAQHQDVILFFQLGDFYETFFEDAELTARELDIALTKRDDAPMAGVPVKRVTFYVNQLLKKGYKVAICEQLQDPDEAKGLVERDVVRIITPGTVLEEELLERGLNNYIAAIYPEGERCGVAYADISTGEFRATELNNDALKNELLRIRPAELILPTGVTLEGLCGEGLRIALSYVEPFRFHTKGLLEHFGILSLDGLGLSELAGRSAAGLLSYITETQKESLAHLRPPKCYELSRQMGLDPFTQRNLEILEELRGSGTSATLFSVLNHTVTGMGERLLRQWLLAPLVDRVEIERRLDAVEFFLIHSIERQTVRQIVERIYDLERLAGRLGAGRITPRDLLSLRQSLERLPELNDLLTQWAGAEGFPEKLRGFAQELHALALDELRALLRRAIRDDAPLELKEGNIITEGFSQELDELKAQQRIYKRKIVELEARERERTGIQTLKVGFNTVFGYYIEVSKAAAKRVPPEYHRKQTLANAERFITPELKEYEEKILSAEERSKRLEYELFCGVRDEAAKKIFEIQQLGRIVAELDLLAALAEVAHRLHYTRPRFTDKHEIFIAEGRHPIVETLLPSGAFVPNDLVFREGEYLIVLTGPNMSGKSVYLRQVALICLLAQIGSFVPAREATLPIVDRIFARVGASDMLAAGYSTFMVEMLETANILNNATERSLIILDEMGRGTSTFDGVSIAWAVAEHLATKIRAKTLFATHYHELTKLAERVPGIKNCHVQVKEYGNQVIFLHKVADGATEGSYGVHVARMAGLPQEITRKADEILQRILQNNPLDAMGELRRRDPRFVKQLAIFAAEEHPVVKELKKIDINALTPLEALELVAQLKRKIESR